MPKINSQPNIRLRHLRPKHHTAHTYKSGFAPGLINEGSTKPAESTVPPESELATMRLINYSDNGLINEAASKTLEEFNNILDGFQKAASTENSHISWVHIQGKPSSQQLYKLGQVFKLHTLALEDVQNAESRSKLESYKSHHFLVLKKLWTETSTAINNAQVSIFLGANYLISFDQSTDDFSDKILQRIHHKGKICSQGADYLLYALIDIIVDNGFNLIDILGDKLEDLEDHILDEPSKETRTKIHVLKRELLLLHKTWWPQREVLTNLLRDDLAVVNANTKIYIRDTYDHCIIQLDFVETYREIASSLLDTYLSAINQRLNDIMKALSIVATIFLPLMFLTGLYGMNFDTDSPWNMPELNWRYGYLYVLGLMAVVIAGLLTFFKKKRWF